MPPPEVQIVVAVLTVIGGILVAWIKGWFTLSESREESKPDTIAELGKRLDEAFERLDEQDRIIAGLRGEIHRMRDQAYEDRQDRHRLKSGIISLVGIARQMARAIIEHFTNEQIDALPQPARGHVRDDDGFEEYLQLARPRTREQQG